MPDKFRSWGELTYLITKQDLHRLAERGGWPETIKDYVDIRERFLGKTAFLLCPGPSLAAWRREDFEGRLTLAINSAMWWVGQPTYTCITEGAYGLWLAERGEAAWKSDCAEREFVMTARGAAMWWFRGLPHKRIWIARHEETGAMPRVYQGVTICHALCTAKWLGCTRVIVFGLDLSKPDGVPYVSGVPHSSEGAMRPYDGQAAALRRLKLAPMEVFNVNPYSNAMHLPFIPMSPEDAARELAAAPRW